MAGKGSRQRTFGSAFNDNYDRIFRKDKVAKEHGKAGSEGLCPGCGGFKKEKGQYPREARCDCSEPAQGPLRGQ